MEATVTTKLALVRVSPRRWAVVRLHGPARFMWGRGDGTSGMVPYEHAEVVFGPDLNAVCQQYIADHAEGW